MPITLNAWMDPPAMQPGAPNPAARYIDPTLYVAYVCQNPKFPGWDSGAAIDHPGFDVYSAVIRFDGVQKYILGAPGEAQLHEHSLHPLGLSVYKFWEVVDCPSIPPGMHRWLATFGDDTLDVTAASASVMLRDIDGEDTSRIVAGFG
jgi:hypothetical protein